MGMGDNGIRRAHHSPLLHLHHPNNTRPEPHGPFTLGQLDNGRDLHDPLHLPRADLPLRRPEHVAHPPLRLRERVRVEPDEWPQHRRVGRRLRSANDSRLGRQAVLDGNRAGDLGLGSAGEHVP